MKKIVLSILIIAFLSTGALAASTTKIGVVDFQKILKMSESGKAAQAQLSKQHKSFTDILQRKKTEIDDLQDKLRRGALAMSPDQRTQKERDIKIQMLDLKDLDKKYKNELKAMDQKFSQQMQSVILELVRGIGEKEKFTLIQEKSAGGVIYVPSDFDITDRVINKMNEMKK